MRIASSRDLTRAQDERTPGARACVKRRLTFFFLVLVALFQEEHELFETLERLLARLLFFGQRGDDLALWEHVRVARLTIFVAFASSWTPFLAFARRVLASRALRAFAAGRRLFATRSPSSAF